MEEIAMWAGDQRINSREAGSVCAVSSSDLQDLG